MLSGGLWDVGTVVDYRPPSAPAVQSLASGTTSGTVDFGRATGQPTSSVSVSLQKPSGSGASASVSDTGSVWRVSLSSLADGEAYTVVLTYTGADGQQCEQAALVRVADAATSPDWQLVKHLDMTQANAQSGLGSDNTYTVTIGSDSLPLVVTHTNSLDPTTTAALVPGSGLVISCSAGSATAWNKMFSFKVSDLVGDLKPDLNHVRIVGLVRVTTMANTSDLISVEFGDGLPVSAADPCYAAALEKYNSTNYRFRTTRRSTTVPTHVNGSTIGTVVPASIRAELFVNGFFCRANADTGSSWPTDADQITTFVSYPGTGAIAGSATVPSVWSSTQYLVLMLAGVNIGTIACTLEGFKVYVAPKRRT